MTVRSDLATALMARYEELKTEATLLKENTRRLEREIADTKEARVKAEADVAAMKRRIMLIEEDLEQSTTRLTETTSKLEEASQLAESSEREQRGLIHEELVNVTELKELENKLQAQLRDIDLHEKSYIEITTRIAQVENQYELKCKEFEKRETEIKKLDGKLIQMATKLKGLQAESYQLTEHEEVFDARTRQLKAQLQETEHRIMVQKAEAQRRESDIKRTQDLLQSERSGFADLKKKLDSVINEL